jgi:uncharacterized protein YuzE
MKIQYFPDTDTLYIEFKPLAAAESKDLDENTVLDYSADRNICAMTLEYASARADIPKFSYEQLVA